MKLVFILPPSPWLMSDRDQPFLGALYVIAYVKYWGYEVQVCDLSGLPEEYWHIPVGDVYGITGTTPHFPYMKKIIDKLKDREPHKKVVVGGVHASVLPNHILQNTKADICVVGEGESVMLDIMNDDSNGNKIVKGKPFEDLDFLPFPDRNSIDYYDYLIPQTYKYLISKTKEASIITGRGCPYNCSFCASNKLYRNKVRFRSATNVYYELRDLKNDYDIGMCNFVDDTFILNKRRVREICDKVKHLDIKWFFLTRVDHVDYDLFVKMREAGCISVTFGFESGSNKVLKGIRKNTTVEEAYNAIDIAKRAGFKIRGQLMVGMPFETDQDVEATAEFIRKANKVDKFGLHVFQPYPGCDVWENPSRYGWKIDKDTNFDKYHTIGKPEARLTDDNKIWNWYNYLKSVIGQRSIDKEIME